MLKILLFLFGSVFAGEWDHLPWIEGEHGKETEIVRRFLPHNPVILEAGAYKGGDTILLMNLWPRATVYAFEACPLFHEELKRNIDSFYANSRHNIHIYPYGLYSKTGEFPFNISAHCDAASSLFEDNKLPECKYDEYQVSIFCKNLDEWAEEENVQRIDYMWLDMEGAELPMLKAAPKMLATVRAISCEVNFREFRKGMPQFKEVKEFMENNGFTLYKIWGSPTWQATAVFIRMKR